MTENASVPEKKEGKVGWKTSFWFGFLWLIYAIFVFSFFLTRGFQTLLDLRPIRVFQKVVLVAILLGIVYLWRKRHFLIPLDYHLSYAPFIAWVLATLFSENDKGISNAYVEVQIIALLTCFYLLRFPLGAFLPRVSTTRISVALFSLILLFSFFVGILFPGLPE